MIDIGFIPNPKEAREGQRELKVVGGSDAGFEPGAGDGKQDGARAMMRGCPKCGHRALIRQENCDICTNCDYNKCG
jgi:ribonucleoside-diphosphate reductase alpha chain